MSKVRRIDCHRWAFRIICVESWGIELCIGLWGRLLTWGSLFRFWGILSIPSCRTNKQIWSWRVDERKRKNLILKIWRLHLRRGRIRISMRLLNIIVTSFLMRSRGLIWKSWRMLGIILIRGISLFIIKLRCLKREIILEN